MLANNQTIGTHYACRICPSHNTCASLKCSRAHGAITATGRNTPKVQAIIRGAAALVCASVAITRLEPNRVAKEVSWSLKETIELVIHILSASSRGQERGGGNAYHLWRGDSKGCEECNSTGEHSGGLHGGMVVKGGKCVYKCSF